MTPKQKNGWKKAGRIIGTLLLVFVLTASIFAGIFMAYINSAMRGKVEVYLDEFETQVSTELYYQDPNTQEWVMYQTLYMDENRIWVDLENIPKYLQKAAIAIETSGLRSTTAWTGRVPPAPFCTPCSARTCRAAPPSPSSW